jgi:hypothetical protein
LLFVLQQANRGYFEKTLKNKEYNNEKLCRKPIEFCENHRELSGEKPNVKMGKTGGGGLDIEKK